MASRKVSQEEMDTKDEVSSKGEKVPSTVDPQTGQLETDQHSPSQFTIPANQASSTKQELQDSVAQGEDHIIHNQPTEGALVTSPSHGSVKSKDVAAGFQMKTKTKAHSGSPSRTSASRQANRSSLHHGGQANKQHKHDKRGSGSTQYSPSGSASSVSVHSNQALRRRQNMQKPPQHRDVPRERVPAVSPEDEAENRVLESYHRVQPLPSNAVFKICHLSSSEDLSSSTSSVSSVSEIFAQKSSNERAMEAMPHTQAANSPSQPKPLIAAVTAAPHSVTENVSVSESGKHGVPYNWQSTKMSLRERLAFMFNNETMADVHFIVGREANLRRIPAHKFVLSIGSAVFDAMFNGGMATTSSEIDLPDIEPAAFLNLLKFLYTDEQEIEPDTVMTTLYTAKKYAVPALEKICVDFLKQNLTSDNAFMLLTQARLFDEPQLAALCLETIDKNTTEALSAEGFTDIDLETLCAVLQRDTLGIRECKLFTAACRWAETECLRQNLPVSSANQRRVLGDSLNLIRFPLMTVEEFAVGAAQSHILSDREVVDLFLYFTVNPKPTVKFLDTPRCCLTGKEQIVSRFCQIESRWGYSGTSDRIRFGKRCMVNKCESFTMKNNSMQFSYMQRFVLE